MNIHNRDNRFYLNGKWRLCYSKHDYDICQISDINLESIDAIVPGNFEIDLMKNDVIDDIYFGENIRKAIDFEPYHKWYYKEFIYKGNKNNLHLTFEGLDTIATIYLNGEKILQTDNMFIPHTINIGEKIKEKNELVVHFLPLFEYAKTKEYPLYSSAFPMNYESLYIRKAPHMYGWDIFPRLVSAGIYKDVFLENKISVIDEIHIDTMEITNNSANMLLYFKLNINDFNIYDYKIVLVATCEESYIKENINILFIAGKYNFKVINPKLWWPNKRGKANLYNTKIYVYKNDKIIDDIQFNFGIRMVKLLRSDLTDEKGNGDFLFHINNERIFILGTNWVPADALHSLDKKKIPKMIEMVKDLGCNMIRCWGGNIYEDDLFYELCDKEGIMVWQDFSFGCAIYPQDDAFIEKIKIEATTIIKRLRTHASLVLWAGDNEVDIAHSWFGKNVNPNNNKINREVLKQLVNLHDTYKEYLPSSPYISERGYLKGEKYLPEYHLWGPRDYYKSDYYIYANCHFASEIGYHGCPSVKSIKKFISAKKIWPYKNNIEWLLHCTSPIPERFDKYNFRVELMANQIAVLFGGIPENINDFSYASQVSQGEAMKFFVELFRSQKWRKTGIIWWNLLDGWPQFSDAIVDYYFEKKIAYEYIKNSQQQILVMMEEEKNNKHNILICNDDRYSYKVEITIYDEENNIVFDKRCYSLKEEVVCVGNIKYDNQNQHIYFINYKINNQKFSNHYISGKPPFLLTWYKDKMDSLL